MSQRFAAMAELVFHRFAQLRERLIKARRDKERVITKPAATTRYFEQSPFAFAFKDRRFIFVSIQACHRNRAVETSGALGGGDTRQQPQKLGIVRRVGTVPRSAGIKVGEACGMNSGRSVQRIDRQTGIIGQR